MSAFKALLVACLLGTSATAHFILGYPTSLGFDDDLEPTAPCGGFSVPAAGASTTANSTNVTVGGFAVALQRYSFARAIQKVQHLTNTSHQTASIPLQTSCSVPVPTSVGTTL